MSKTMNQDYKNHMLAENLVVTQAAEIDRLKAESRESHANWTAKCDTLRARVEELEGVLAAYENCNALMHPGQLVNERYALQQRVEEQELKLKTLHGWWDRTATERDTLKARVEELEAQKERAFDVTNELMEADRNLIDELKVSLLNATGFKDKYWERIQEQERQLQAYETQLTLQEDGPAALLERCEKQKRDLDYYAGENSKLRVRVEELEAAIDCQKDTFGALIRILTKERDEYEQQKREVYATNRELEARLAEAEEKRDANFILFANAMSRLASYEKGYGEMPPAEPTIVRSIQVDTYSDGTKVTTYLGDGTVTATLEPINQETEKCR